MCLKRGSLNRTDIVEYTRNHGGWADLPRKSLRKALDFVIEEITQNVLIGESVKPSGVRDVRGPEEGDRLWRNPRLGRIFSSSEVGSSILSSPPFQYWEWNQDKAD